MKKQILALLVTLLFTSIQSIGQSSLKYVDATIEFADAQRPCIQVNLDPEPKTLKKAWKSYLKDNYDFKLSGIGFLTNKDLLTAEEIQVKAISPNTMDFYTHIIEDENGSEMKVFLRFGYDIYITSKTHPKEYKVVTEIMDNFLKSYLPKYYNELIKETEKRVSDLKKETEDLKDDISDNSEEIKDLKKEIEELEKELKSNSELLWKATKKLEKRSEKLERVKNQLKNL
jgi:peptidoglycan hydrolase CwlO-like protein